MDNIFKLLTSIVAKLLKEEMKSIAGKVNLIGGVMMVALTVCIFLQNIGVVIINFFLSLFGKTLLPNINSWYLILIFLFIAGYFYLCVKVISDTE